MSLLTPIDNYCERADPSFWAEPLNAFTNLAFLIAAYYAYRLWHKRKSEIGPSYLVVPLCIIVACVGLGSLAFHTFANRWSMIADVLFIAIFMYSYIGGLLRVIFRLHAMWVIMALLGFFGLGYVIDRAVPPAMFNGSESYFAAIIMFTGVTVFSYMRRLPHSHILLTGLVTFLVSIGFRSVDEAWCGAFPLGTHFAWHTLNGVVLYLLMRYLILNYPRMEKS
jgi:hypothetical protein